MLHRGAERLAAVASLNRPLSWTRSSSARSDVQPTIAERTRVPARRSAPQPRSTAIEDLLWSVVMLPEFQLVR